MNPEVNKVDMDPNAAARVQQEISLRDTINRIKNTVVVQSGKGGVGKSTVTWNLALSFAQKGLQVGIMDGDITGPSIPMLAGLTGKSADISGRKIIPTLSNNIHIISMDLLLNQDTPVIWRGPLKMAALRQFLSDVQWPNLDILLIDLPPGTSDEPLTIAQLFENITGTVIVTTPQKVATHDVQKSIGFASKVGMPILGIIENMSGLTCPHCGELIPVFKTGGGIEMAEKLGLIFLGAIPLEPEVVIQGDDGQPSLLIEGRFKESFEKIASKVAKLLQLE
jgi:ATP-binding protein involved in chromosome partitioning